MNIGIGGNKKFLIPSLILILIIISIISYVIVNKKYESVSSFENQNQGVKDTNVKSDDLPPEDRDNHYQTLVSTLDKFESVSKRMDTLEKLIEKMILNSDSQQNKIDDLVTTDSENMKIVAKELEKFIDESTDFKVDDVNVSYPVNGTLEEEKPQENNSWIIPSERAYYNQKFDVEKQTSNLEDQQTRSQFQVIKDTISNVDDFVLDSLSNKKNENSVSGLINSTNDSNIDKEDSKPVFTIPQNATIFDSVLVTGLVGRIPTSNNLNDPYRFKILTGPEAISSNSIYLPSEISTMTFSGTASGDWVLSCARGKIDSVTYTFNDGEIYTQNASGNLGLGWISDGYGIPCVSGLKVSTSSSTLIKRMLAGAVTNGANTYASAQTERQFNNGGTLVTIEDANEFAAFNAIAGGADELQNHLDRRLSQTFEAIYVPNATKVQIHIEQPITIDRNINNRKVRYENETNNTIALD